MGYNASISQLDLCVINLRADAMMRDRIAASTNVPLPTSPNTVTSAGQRRLLWLGNDHWLLVSTDRDDDTLVEAINQSMQDGHGNATLVTDQYTSFQLDGPEVLEVLAQGCALPLEADRFSEGQCVSCTFAKTQVTLLAIAHADSYQLLVESSLAGYVLQWFERALGPNN
jgi:heterotetrameric sarcosine oxidase gamma subunit